MAGGVAQVHQAAFRQQQQVVIGRFVAVNLVYLGFNFFPFPVFAHKGGIDFIIEVADVAHHGARLQLLQHELVAHVDVASGGHQQVGFAQQVAVYTVQCAEVFTVNVR